MNELGNSLERMSFVQLLLLFAFVTSYVLALGGLLGTPARRRTAVLALGLAVAFSAPTDPWVHGALLMAFVVAGLGLFVVLTWLLARLFGPRAELQTEAVTTEPATSQAALLAPRAEDEPVPPRLPKLVRRARVSRS